MLLAPLINVLPEVIQPGKQDDHIQIWQVIKTSQTFSVTMLHRRWTKLYDCPSSCCMSCCMILTRRQSLWPSLAFSPSVHQLLPCCSYTSLVQVHTLFMPLLTSSNELSCGILLQSLLIFVLWELRLFAGVSRGPQTIATQAQVTDDFNSKVTFKEGQIKSTTWEKGQSGIGSWLESVRSVKQFFILTD